MCMYTLKMHPDYNVCKEIVQNMMILLCYNAFACYLPIL